ncbi:MAG: 3-deoxy-8-phosphooctulonate synthase [Acidobacteriota bacterium]
MTEIFIGEKIKIPSECFFLIAGPCVIENEKHTYFMAKNLKRITDELNIPFIFKSSYDKANRLSIDSYRGPGIKEGLKILSNIKKELEIPVLSDVHETNQIELAAEVLDVIQIPALLSRQTDLVVEAAKTNKPINLKKGQFLSPWNVKNIVEKALAQGNHSILITERGTTFGYNNLVVDFKSIPIMKEFGFPVIIDATHAVQLPGAAGTSSGGNSKFTPHMAKAGIAVGADGVFLEVHENPEKALSDGPNSLRLDELYSLLRELKKLYKLINKRG